MPNDTITNSLKNKTILITGITGLIGSTLVHCLLSLNKDNKIIAPLRDIKKAKLLFSEEEQKYIIFYECDLLTFDYGIIKNVDYIIHCAAPTSSRFFVEHPVETSDIIYNGTRVLLEYARQHPIKGFVYLSSLEVYGEIHNDETPITEDVQGYIDTMSIRSSYPMAKRAAENLCCAYAAQYNIPVKVARLTQTTGPGIDKNDNRVIAQFARLAANGQDIVLHTTGESARPYCYTIDAINAILYILLLGEKGEAYNVANEETYISAKSMADFLKQNFNPNIKVRIELNDNMGYAPATLHKLSSEKLRKLGWAPQYGLFDIFTNLINYLKE